MLIVTIHSLWLSSYNDIFASFNSKCVKIEHLEIISALKDCT